MSLTSRLIKSGLHIFAGHGTSQALSFLRNFAIARLVSPEDFGIAAAFAATISTIELASDIAWDKLLIQAPDGDDLDLQAVCHSTMIIRGTLVAAFIFLTAPFFASLFKIPHALWAFQLLAITPLFKGFAHLDVKRIQRHFRFSHDVNITILAQFIGVVVALGGAYLLRDYRAMLYSITIQGIVTVIATHLVAERRYCLAWKFNVVQRVVTFGWPLMLNGIIIAASGQGDRFLVGGYIDLKALAVYTAAAVLVASPGLVAMRVVGALALPLLASGQADRSVFIERYRYIGAFILISALVIFVPLAMCASTFVTWTFGEGYSAPAELAAWLSIGFGIRFVRGWPTVAALAIGDTKNLMIANAVRILGLMFGILALHSGGGLISLAISLAAGELVSSAVSVARFSRIAHVSPLVGSKLVAIVATCYCISLLCISLVEDTSFFQELLLSAAIVSIGIASAWFASPEVRLATRNTLNKVGFQ